MSGANGGRVRKIIEPTDNEIVKYFLTAENEGKGDTWVDVSNERKITVVSKTKNSTILSVESLRRPGSNNKTIYKSFNAFQTDAPKVWEKLKELKEPFRNYVLIYDKLSCEETKTRKKTYNGTCYAKMINCKADGNEEKRPGESIVAAWKGGYLKTESGRRLKSKAINRVKENFDMLDQTVDEIHKLGLDTLDIKPDNLFFECGIMKRFVLADLDSARVDESEYKKAGQTSGYTFGKRMSQKEQDKFALYVSFIEILAPDFFPTVIKEEQLNTETTGLSLGRFDRTKKGKRIFETPADLAKVLKQYSDENIRVKVGSLRRYVSYKKLIDTYIYKIGSNGAETVKAAIAAEKYEKDLLERAEKVKDYLEYGVTPKNASEPDVKKAEKAKKEQEKRARNMRSVIDIFAPPSDDDSDLIKTLSNKLKF